MQTGYTHDLQKVNKLEKREIAIDIVKFTLVLWNAACIDLFDMCFILYLKETEQGKEETHDHRQVSDMAYSVYKILLQFARRFWSVPAVSLFHTHLNRSLQLEEYSHPYHF